MLLRGAGTREERCRDIEETVLLALDGQRIRDNGPINAALLFSVGILDGNLLSSHLPLDRFENQATFRSGTNNADFRKILDSSIYKL
jgi:hypothetical protein